MAWLAPISLTDAVVALTAAPKRPILIVDTCALLDIVRAPMRESPQRLITAFRELDAAIRQGLIHVPILPPVLHEWTERSKTVRAEVERFLVKMDADFARVRQSCLEMDMTVSATSSVAATGVAAQLVAMIE